MYFLAQTTQNSEAMEGVADVIGGLLAGGFILSLLFMAFILFMTILWFFVPFAIFGIKPRLDKILHSLQVANAWHEDVHGRLEALEKRVDGETLQIQSTKPPLEEGSGG